MPELSDNNGCYGVRVGYLEIWYKICLPIVFYSDSDEVSDPSLVFEEYFND